MLSDSVVEAKHKRHMTEPSENIQTFDEIESFIELAENNLNKQTAIISLILLFSLRLRRCFRAQRIVVVFTNVRYPKTIRKFQIFGRDLIERKLWHCQRFS